MQLLNLSDFELLWIFNFGNISNLSTLTLTNTKAEPSGEMFILRRWIVDAQLTVQSI